MHDDLKSRYDLNIFYLYWMMMVSDDDDDVDCCSNQTQHELN